MNKQSEEYLFGIRPVAEAILSGKPIDKVILRQGNHSEGFKDVFDLIQKHHIPYQYVPDAKLNQFTRLNHQGIVAFVSLIEYQSAGEIVDRLFEEGKEPFLLMLDRVTDVRNFGAIARTAECAGVHAIIIPEKGAARVNGDAIKASAGALMRIAVCRADNLIRNAVALMEQGITLISVTEKGNLPYYEADFAGPVCLIMGSEEDGISPPLLKMSTQRVKIPQYGKIGSLNVSVATGIVLFDAAFRRKTPDSIQQ